MHAAVLTPAESHKHGDGCSHGRLKRCTKCGRLLTLDKFYKKKSRLSSRCKDCQADYHAKWYADNAEKRRAQIAAYKAAHTNEQSIYAANYRAVSINAVRRRLDKISKREGKSLRQLLDVNNRSLEELRDWFDSAVHCPLCGHPFASDTEKCIDHEHGTGKLRAILCQQCNFRLGQVENNLDDLPGTLAALRSWDSLRQDSTGFKLLEAWEMQHGPVRYHPVAALPGPVRIFRNPGPKSRRRNDNCAGFHPLLPISQKITNKRRQKPVDLTADLLLAA